MSPWGRYVEKLRIERKMPRSTLARKLTVHPSNLCNMVYGRKSIPRGDFNFRISKILKLNDEEEDLLIKAAEQSSKINHLPDSAVEEEYQVFHAITSLVGQIPKWKLKMILDLVNN